MRVPMRNIAILSLSIFAVAIACGGSQDQSDSGSTDDAAPDTGDQSDAAADVTDDVDHGHVSTTYPAFKVDAPQVLSFNGALLKTPKVVPVYFGNDTSTFTDQITTFLGKLASSPSYWPTPVTEYGIGAMTIASPIPLTESADATLSDAQIQTWLQTKLTSNDPLWPAPDANTVYALFYPAGTTISLGQGGGTSCQSFGGYHSNIKVGTTDVAYAVMPRCSSFGGLTGVNAVTATTSHELIEAATDPYPQDQANAGYAQVDDNHIIWEFVLGGGEVGDMCAQNQGAFYKNPDIGNYVQRTWSNKSAAAGHNPCIPLDGLPYFNSMPVLNENVSVGGGQLTTKGVTIPVGSSKTIEVDLFSDADTGGPWQVAATDSATLQQQAPELELSFDKTSGQNGEKLYLTIKVLKASQYGAEAFILESQLNGRSNLWVGLVGN